MNTTHVGTRNAKGEIAVFEFPVLLDEGSGYAVQLEKLRKELTEQVTREMKERPVALLIGIQGSKK